MDTVKFLIVCPFVVRFMILVIDYGNDWLGLGCELLPPLAMMQLACGIWSAVAALQSNPPTVDILYQI